MRRESCFGMLEFETGEVVTICDHLGLFRSGELNPNSEIGTTNFTNLTK